MLSRLLQSLNIRKGEGLSVAALLGWSMFQGVFIAFYLTASNTAFLDDWGYMNLPQAIIASGLLGFFALREYARAEARFSLKTLLLGSHMVNLTLVLVFSLGSQFTANKWFSFLTFIWIGPSLGMVALGFWGMAGRLFNLQQSKRLFGLISSGEVASNIVAFLAIPFLSPSFKTASSLLLFSALGLFCSMLMSPVILKVLSNHLLDQAEEEESSDSVESNGAVREDAPPAPRWDIYFILISALAFFAIINQQFLDFALLAQFDQFGSGQQLASLLAIYFGAMSLTELLVKTFISGRLLRAYGVMTGLFSLPVAVLLCVLFAAFKTNTESTFFFVLILTTKILEHVTRFSIFDPSFKVLFQPLSSQVRFSIQTRVEGMIRQGSVVVSGFTLLIITRQADFQITDVIRVMLVLLVFWLIATFFIYKEYRKKLMARLRQHSLKSIIKSPVEQLEQAMEAMSEQELDYALNVIEQVEPGLMNLYLPKLLKQGSPQFRTSLLARIRRLHQLEITDALQQMLNDPQFESAREDIQQTYDQLLQYKAHQLPYAKIAALAASPNPNDRSFAALLLRKPSGAKAVELLRKMLWDDDPSVRQAAILSAGVTKNPLYWSRLIELLSSGIYCKFAATALTASGEAVADADFTFYRFRKQPEIQTRILRVHERIGGEQAVEFLLDKIVYPHRDIRSQALYSLGYVGYQASLEMVGMVKSDIKTKVKYIAWNTAARLDIGREGHMALTYQALKWELLQSFEMLYLLLALICDKQAIKLIRRNVTRSEEARAFALEVAEHATPADLKHLLFPLFEYLGPQQRLARLSLHCPQETLGPKERLLELLVQGPSYINSWTRACAVDALFRLGHNNIPDALVSNLQHPNRMVREVTARTIRRLDQARFTRLLNLMPRQYAHQLKDLGVEMDSRTGIPDKKLLIFDKIVQLKKIPIFENIHETVLVRYASQIQELRLEPDQRLFNKGDSGDNMFFIISGSIRVHKEDGQAVAVLEAGRMVGEIAVLETGVRTLGAVSDDFTHLFSINREMTMDMMSDHLEIMPDFIKTIVRRRKRA